MWYFFRNYSVQDGNTALCLKKYHKNEWHLCLVANSFTKLSWNVYLINTHILIYWHAKCNCKSWKTHLFYCIFWVFQYIIVEHSSLKYCIFSKLSQIVCLINVYILICQHTKCDCRLWKVLWFNYGLWEFSYYYYT